MTKIQKFSLLIGLILVVINTACVPNRKLVLLQENGDEYNKKYALNTPLRSYDYNEYEYLIQSGDILYITFKSLTIEEFDIFSRASDGGGQSSANNPELTGYNVNSIGEIDLPVLGKVIVTEKTIDQLSSYLQELSNQYVDGAVVSVKLVNLHVTILGEVKTEGTFNSTNTRLSILEAIGAAGGFTDLADRSQIKIIRQKGTKSEIVYVNLLSEDLLGEEYFFVHQNDVIIVAPLRQRPFRNYFSQNFNIVLTSLSTILLLVNLLQK